MTRGFRGKFLGKRYVHVVLSLVWRWLYLILVCVKDDETTLGHFSEHIFRYQECGVSKRFPINYLVLEISHFTICLFIQIAGAKLTNLGIPCIVDSWNRRVDNLSLSIGCCLVQLLSSILVRPSQSK